MKNLIQRLTLVMAMSCIFFTVYGQSPGLVVKPAGGNGVTALNPNGDGYCTTSGTGFVSNDITESEIPFKMVPVALNEPFGDIRTGPSGGFTDIVPGAGGSGFYIHKDAVNIYFRLRIGNIANGAKGYSVLIDTDGKIGATGAAPDPNYVAPGAGNNGNPGFEYEVALFTNFNVSVYSIDGTASPAAPVVYGLNTNSQVSVALTLDHNNADYFYDWYVPLSAIGNPASIRVAATTLASPNPACSGQRSDIYGIDDALFANISNAWETVIKAQPAIVLGSFSGVGANCTSAPVLVTGIAAGTAVNVTGSWSRLSTYAGSSATISLFKNGVPAGSTSVSSGGTWSIPVPTLVAGDLLYARAQASGESLSEISASVVVSSCLVLPAIPILSCASLKGISGTMPSNLLGNTVRVYQLAVTTASPFSTQVSTGVNLTYPTALTFSYFTNGCSGGTNNVTTGEYMIVSENSSCNSEPVFVCISSGSSGIPPAISTNAISLTSTLYANATGISGTGATSGSILRLFVNGKYVSSISVTGSAFTFTGLNLQANDRIRIYQQIAGSCITQSAQFLVNCFTAAPAIILNATGNLLSGLTTIRGTSAHIGALVQVYKGTAPAGVIAGVAVSVGLDGSWIAIVPTLLAGESYYAVQTINGCVSGPSAPAPVLTPAACPTITGTYTDKSPAVTGTLPSSFTGTVRLYIDGVLIGSQAVSASTTWSINVPLNMLYYQGVLSATAQAPGGAESSACATVVVNCASPVTPVVTPLTVSVNPGQLVNYSVSNVNSNCWYSVVDALGNCYATSLYRTTTSAFTLPTSAFTNQGTYSLQIKVDELTGCPAISVGASVVVHQTLPLQLLNFSGHYDGSSSQFNWSTTEEINVSHFELEKSADGVNFVSIGHIALQTNNDPVDNYLFTAPGVLQQETYFRLKIVDIDGSRQYSRIIVLRPGAATGPVLSAMPNPFRETAVVRYTSARAFTATVVVRSSDGRIVAQSQQAMQPGENTFSVNGTSTLLPGVYYLQVMAPGEKTPASVTLLKQKP